MRADIDGHGSLQPRNGLVAQGVDIHVFDGKRMARSRHVEYVAKVDKAEMALANGLAILERGIARRTSCACGSGGSTKPTACASYRTVIALVDAPSQRRINKVGCDDANVLEA